MTSSLRKALFAAGMAALFCAVVLAAKRGAFGGSAAHGLPGVPDSLAARTQVGEASVLRSVASAPPGPQSRPGGEVAWMRSPSQAPAWATPFGAEFWRAHVAHASPAVSSRGFAPGLSHMRLAEAVERVSHAFEREAAGGSARAEGDGFLAGIDSAGLSLSPGASQDAARNPVRFHTRTVCRGQRACYRGGPPASGWQVIGNTAQALLEPASGLVEHYEVRRDGVEVTWLAPRPLEGEGSLAITAELEGAWFRLSVGSSGPSAGDPDLPRVRVGNAIAVDQDGRSWPVPLELAGNSLRVTVPSAVLDEARFPLAVDPLLTPEFPLDSAVAGPTPCTRAAPAVAANESGYLVVWTHGKSDITDAGVYAARVDLAGALLDPNGIMLSAQAGEQSVCAVGANPGLFLVAWAAPHGTSITDWDILGMRITSAGAVLDSTPLPICTVISSVQNSPAVAGNGDNFLVAWRDSRNTAIYGTIVGSDGSFSVANGGVLVNGLNDQYTPAVAALGTNYLVVAQDYRRATSSAYNSDIYGARVDGTGVLLDTAGIAICTNSGSQFHPAVASDGTNWLVVWQDYDLGGSDVLGARVSPDGIVLDTNALVIGHAANAQSNPAATGDNGAFLVVWQDYRDSAGGNYEAKIYGSRVSDEGLVLDAGGVPLSSASGGQCYPAVAAGAGGGLAVWQDFRQNPGSVWSDIFGARLSVGNALAAAPDGQVSGAQNAEVSPAVAALGTNYLAVWEDNRHATSNGWDICGTRLDAGGTPLDPGGLWICTAANRQGEPTVAAGQSNYFAAWRDLRNTPATMQHGDIYGTFVSPEGLVQPADGIAVCTATNDQSAPSVAAFGTNFMVVWQDTRGSLPAVTRWDIYGARVSAAGAVLDPGGIGICTNLAAQSNAVVAATATRALVVWSDNRPNSIYTDIYGARLDPDGTVVDTNGIAICTALGSQNLPAIATDGSSFLVVWADSRGGAASAPDIYGARVDDGGAVSPTNGIAIRSAPGPQTAPAVAFNGLDYLVTWQEATNSLSRTYGIFATQVGNDASLGLGPLLPVVANANSHVSPAVAAGADGRFLVLNQVSLENLPRARAGLVNSEAVPRLDAAVAAATGRFRFRFRGAVGERYTIESSDDLRQWTPRWTFTNAAPASEFLDPDTTNLPARFYRAVLLQP